MKPLMFFFIVFFAQVVNLEACSCYNRNELDKIEFAIKSYKTEAEKNYYWEVPLDPWSPWRNLPREQWEYPYHERIQKLNNALLYEDVSRYPVIYHNILIYDQKIDVMSDYGYEKAYMDYFGPNVPWTPYSKEQKEAFVGKDRAKEQKYENKTRDALNDLTAKVINIYLKLHEECIKKHVSLQTYRDYGLLAHLNNNFDLSLEMLQRLMDEAEKTGQLDLLDSKYYHELGSVCFEAMEYNKAIEYLSESIRKDPQNKNAYFDRALAYFETGDFDLALGDYLTSDKRKEEVSLRPGISEEFAKALLAGVVEGAGEAAVDFVPSMCSTIHGLGQALWAEVSSPIKYPGGPLIPVNQFVASCKEIGDCLVDIYKISDQNTLDDCCDQVKTLYEQYENLSDKEKGQLIGSGIGKYGIEIFAVGGTVKAVKAIRHLRNANRLCTLESLALSNANKEAVISSAIKHAAEREAYFKNVKILWDLQNNHIPGKPNFIITNSIWEHPNPQGLLQKFAGKGKKVGPVLPGNPGYKEVVDFGEYVGIWKDPLGKKAFPTTRGTIHYRKTGAHIIPAHPEGKILQ